MNKKRITIGIVAAVIAVVCIAVFTQRKGPQGTLPENGSAAGGQGEAPVHLDPDSPLALLAEDEAEEASPAGGGTAETAGADEKEKEAAQEQKEETGKTPAGGQEDHTKEQEAPAGTREEAPGLEEEGAGQEEEGAGQEEEGVGQKQTEGSAWTEYDDFMAKSPAEQDAFIKSFENMDAFAEWLVRAREEWTEAHPVDVIGPGGTIDLGQ